MSDDRIRQTERSKGGRKRTKYAIMDGNRSPKPPTARRRSDGRHPAFAQEGLSPGGAVTLARSGRFGATMGLEQIRGPTAASRVPRPASGGRVSVDGPGREGAWAAGARGRGSERSGGKYKKLWRLRIDAQVR